MTALDRLRIGHGYDVHPFESAADAGRPLVLGGVQFDGEPGLVGHSDADAIAHACTDAVLGPLDLGDIGTLFPDTDPSLAGADSMALLRTAIDRVHASGAQVVNIDVTVVAERPKISPRRTEMERLLSEAVHAPVTVKGKRGEGLDAIGRGEGIACHAVALLQIGEAT